MAYSAEKRDYIGYSNRLDALCVRLKAAGYQVASTRLDAYRKTFARNELLIRENRSSELLAKIPFPKFLNDFHESNEILEACDEFPDLNTPGLRDRLEKVLAGTEELRQEAPQKGGARNFLFELVMAATLKQAGFQVRLDQIEDVFFNVSDRIPCFMECKRVHSQRRLGELISDAASQIRQHCNNSSHRRACGIVAVDVSKLLNVGDRLFDAQTRDGLSSAAKQRLESYAKDHRDTLQSIRERCVLGVYVYARLPGAVRQPVGLWTARCTIFIILHHPKTRSGKLAFRFFNKIERSITQKVGPTPLFYTESFPRCS
jgi:hypothetical protein